MYWIAPVVFVLLLGELVCAEQWQLGEFLAQGPVVAHREEGLGEKKPCTLGSLRRSLLPRDEEFAQREEGSVKTLGIGS